MKLSWPIMIFGAWNYFMGMVLGAEGFLFIGMMLIISGGLVKLVIEDTNDLENQLKKNKKLQKKVDELEIKVRSLSIQNEILYRYNAEYRKKTGLSSPSPSSVVSNCWSILGINPTNDKTKITSAYKDLMQIHHPDRRGEKGVEVAKKINAAKDQALKIAGK